MRLVSISGAFLLMALPAGGAAWGAPGGSGWVVSWVGSAQGPYPSGNDLAQPDLKAVFPVAAAGAQDQSFRLIVKPEIWGCQTRLRLSNAFGSRPVTFAGVHVGLQQSGSALVRGSNRPVAFGGKSSVKVAPGDAVWSDAVSLPFACNAARGGALAGRKLAVSFHIPGQSGPMTWHAKALQTSYVTAPRSGSGAVTAEEGEAAFPFSTTSWYFLDALDMRVRRDVQAIVALGDSITDGTNSTLNGDDRWPDVLARRLRAAYGDRLSVVNAGIGGNQVRGPAEYSLREPVSGGPSALARLDRDVLSLSGVSTVIWFEGINDLSKQINASVPSIQAGLREGVARIRAKIPGVRVFGATLTTALGAVESDYGQPEQDARRQELNAFIRTTDLFDAVLDFDQAVRDPATGRLRPELAHDTTVGGPADGIHPNRLGYQAMARSMNLALFRPRAANSAHRPRQGSHPGSP